MEKRKVLLVEDDADVRRLYALGLNQRGFEVKLAANGAEAIERIMVDRPDFILLDWLMPLMSGSEVVARVAEHDDGSIEIIVISGQPPPDPVPPRVRRWLTKPISIDDLVTELEHA